MLPRHQACCFTIVTVLAFYRPAVAGGQTLGDSVRIQFAEGQGWWPGRLAEIDTTGLVLISGLERNRFSRDEIFRADRWVKNRAEVQILAGALTLGTNFALWWKPPEVIRDGDRIGIREGVGFTDTRAGDAAIGAVAGALLGLAFHAIWPGRWKRWRPWRSGDG